MVHTPGVASSTRTSFVTRSPGGTTTSASSCVEGSYNLDPCGEAKTTSLWLGRPQSSARTRTGRSDGFSKTRRTRTGSKSP